MKQKLSGISHFKSVSRSDLTHKATQLGGIGKKASLFLFPPNQTITQLSINEHDLHFFHEIVKPTNSYYKWFIPLLLLRIPASIYSHCNSKLMYDTYI